MSDRYHALTVVLDDDYRAEDIETLMGAIRMLRGVADVAMTVASVEDVTARMRVRCEMQTKIYNAIRGVFEGKT